MGIFDFFGFKTITPTNRRNKTIQRLKKEGITINENLPLLPSSEQLKFKSEKEIMNRIIAAYTSIQVACSIRNGEDIYSSINYMLDFMDKCNGSRSYLLDKEKNIIDRNYSTQDVADIIWSYEGVFTLMWAIGYKADKYAYDVSKNCNGDYVTFDMILISRGTNTEPILKKEKVLNMLDLFYCYQWACREKKKNPEISIGNINYNVVTERLRALKWLISDEIDWFNIEL